MAELLQSQLSEAMVTLTLPLTLTSSQKPWRSPLSTNPNPSPNPGPNPNPNPTPTPTPNQALIASHDFPAKWQTLLPGLLPQLETATTQKDYKRVSGLLQILHSICKRYRHEF